MLTFRFTSVEGTMENPEILTSGMVGKEVRLVYSRDWDPFIKTVVFSAGPVVRSVVGAGDVAVIPAEVLAVPLKQLQVGVFGISPDTGEIRPTVRAMGPVIRPGIDPSCDAGADPDLPVWAQLTAMIGNLEDLDTEARNNLVDAINETAKTDCIKTINGLPPDENGNMNIRINMDMAPIQSQGGMSATASALLINILRSAMYTADQSANITALESALASGGGDADEPGAPVEPDEPVVTTYTIVNVLTNVTNSNSAAKANEGAGYTATLTPAEGFNLDSVIVTMGGVDVTADVYADGVINIESVTGAVIITASAAEDSATAPVYELTSPLVCGDASDPRINDTAKCQIATGEIPYDNEDWTICVDFTSLAGGTVTGGTFIADTSNPAKRFLVSYSAPYWNLSVHGAILASFSDYSGDKFIGTNICAVLTHVADSNTWDLYGTKEGTHTAESVNLPINGQIVLGSTKSLGTINRFAMYKRVLSADEITAWIGG